jgi:hypothetical protein
MKMAIWSLEQITIPAFIGVKDTIFVYYSQLSSEKRIFAGCQKCIISWKEKIPELLN